MGINAVGIIFSNMHDEEMHEITNSRTMGALPFGGRYRLIDFPLSNMTNSGITNVGIIAKSNYQSLMEHLGSGKEWDLSRKREGLYIFPPFSRLTAGVYQNKIEALNGIMPFIKEARNDYVVITDCDTICNLNWDEPLYHHMRMNADITLLYYRMKPPKPLDNELIYSISPDGYITDILMNQTVNELNNIGTNMWIIKKNLLIKMVEDGIAHNYDNLEKDIFQKKLDQYKMVAWEIKGYVRKINSMTDYFGANMDVLDPYIRQDLFYKYGPIYTKVYDVVPARYCGGSAVTNSMIADGCIIDGKVENSILFRGVKVGKGAIISNSIIMNQCMIGENVILDYVLSDKNVIFQENRVLVGCETRPSYITKGSTL